MSMATRMGWKPLSYEDVVNAKKKVDEWYKRHFGEKMVSITFEFDGELVFMGDIVVPW